MPAEEPVKELTRRFMYTQQTPLLLKEGCREAAGWFLKKRSHLIEVRGAHRLKWSASRYLSTTSALARHPYFKRRGFLCESRNIEIYT
jgi:hypothetical protein